MRRLWSDLGPIKTKSTSTLRTKKQTQFTIHFHFPNKTTLDNVISVKNVYFSLVIRFSAKYLHSIFLISSKHITIESEMALHLHLHFQQRDMKLIKTFCNSEYVSTSRKCSTIFVFIANITTLNIAVIMVIITIKIAFIVILPVYIAVIILV